MRVAPAISVMAGLDLPTGGRHPHEIAGSSPAVTK